MIQININFFENIILLVNVNKLVNWQPFEYIEKYLFTTKKILVSLFLTYPHSHLLYLTHTHTHTLSLSPTLSSTLYFSFSFFVCHSFSHTFTHCFSIQKEMLVIIGVWLGFAINYYCKTKLPTKKKKRINTIINWMTVHSFHLLQYLSINLF